MDIFDAIYTRQSVDKMDSISVESQTEFCRKEVIGQTRVKVYTDKGYSGKNIDRPAFQELIRDIEAGKVSRVIVYRLDRISRSVLDFANVINIFQKHNVDFVSTMEKFDTATPIGKAMLMIVMIFAQLERETIQQRVIDAYVSRSKRGFFMGGHVPYGFKLKDTIIDGISTKMYEQVPEEVDVLKLIFSMYAEHQTSFGDVMRYLNDNGLLNRHGKPFNRTRIRDLVINPVYVKADYKIYDFFKSQGSIIVNSPEDFIGINGAYLYSGDIAPRRKTVTLEGHSLVLAPHDGIIDSDTWIKCRSKCLNNHMVAKPIKAKTTWLAGKIKCPNCGYALVVKIGHRKIKEDKRYYLCSHKYSTGNCDFGSLDADVVDKIVLDEMRKKLSEFDVLTKKKQDTNNLQAIKIKTQIEAIDREIGALLDKIVEANETVMQYINNRVAELDLEKNMLGRQLEQLDKQQNNDIDKISNYMAHWDKLSISDKITVVDSIIESICASDEKIEIKWKI